LADGRGGDGVRPRRFPDNGHEGRTTVRDHHGHVGQRPDVRPRADRIDQVIRGRRTDVGAPPVRRPGRRVAAVRVVRPRPAPAGPLFEKGAGSGLVGAEHGDHVPDV